MYPETQIVVPTLAWVTVGSIAPGVRLGSGSPGSPPSPVGAELSPGEGPVADPAGVGEGIDGEGVVDGAVCGVDPVTGPAGELAGVEADATTEADAPGDEAGEAEFVEPQPATAIMTRASVPTVRMEGAMVIPPEWC